ncbi:50S ribosomal protein L9 [Blattabacterium cuenoti]|uniref:50S ribosomal protein L9 n=1 Tax=Blattabacterium cuenoti TaxID=1653831 RepID=UPI00163C1C79|nr:50S ribosomal protein L9 [Blattabacterium cuenoti]
MKIILKKYVENLGFQYDEIHVKSGYARNYLIPKGLAIFASYSSIKNNNEILKQRNKKDKYLIEKSKDIEKKLGKIIIKIYVKVNKNGKIFGSINNQNISEFISKKGMDIKKQYIKIVGNKVIKSVGKYQANIRLHRKHEFLLDFEILSS